MTDKFVLFDFDGVIADSFAIAYDTARLTHTEVRLTEEMYRTWFEGNIYESIAKHAPGGRRDDAYFERAKSRIHEVALMPGADAAVRALASHYKLVVISSTTSSLIKSFLDRYTLTELFAEIMGSDVHVSKVEKIAMVFRKYKVEASDCVFVTDTLGDIREAAKHRVGAIACAWGWHTRNVLEQGMPFRIIEQPSDLPDTVDDYFSTPN